MPRPHDIAPRALLARLASHDAPLVLDLRVDEDWRDNPVYLPASRRVDYRDLDAHLALLGGRSAVTLCHKGLKISQGAAARLRAKGIQAEVLEGGAVAWIDAGWPVFDSAAPAILVLPDPLGPLDALTVWACLRFRNPLAEVIQVPTPHMAGVIDRFAEAPGDLSDFSALPSFGALLVEANRAGGVLAKQTAGAASLTDLFTCFDAFYRGALEEHVTEVSHSGAAKAPTSVDQ